MKHTQRQNEAIVIVNFSPDKRECFKILNYEWIERYFHIEPQDEFVLDHPEEAIINKGGKIFFAQSGAQVHGTCALSPVDADTWELGKMAVRSSEQGKGIGELLLCHAIAYAQSTPAKRLTLYSNTSLVAAVRLYEKHGFREIPKNDFHSMRANIKMERKLVK